MREGIGNKKCNFGKRGQVDIDEKKKESTFIEIVSGQRDMDRAQRNQGGQKHVGGDEWMLNATIMREIKERAGGGWRGEVYPLLISLVSYLLPLLSPSISLPIAHQSLFTSHTAHLVSSLPVEYMFGE